MKERISLLIFFILLIGVVPRASAVTLEAADMRLGINGYINGIYTYMSKMAMVMDDPMGGPPMLGTQSDTSTFENDTHLLFNAVKDRLRMNLNISFHNSTSISGGDMGGETTGAFDLLETYGEYAFSEPFQVRVGNFLSPFGIYNQIRHITPLFATVVLPIIYELPENYEGKSLIPENATMMLFGSYSTGMNKLDYYLYGGNGKVGPHGEDENKNKGFGGRIRLTLPHNLKIGGSYYSVEDDPGAEGRRQLYGADLNATAGDINLQAEYVLDDLEKAKNRFAYYARLSYSIDKFLPFIGLDYFKDKGDDMLFKRGMYRYSAGTSYSVNNYITLKAEYHYHKLDDTEGLMDVPDDIQMFRGAAIFIF